MTSPSNLFSILDQDLILPPDVTAEGLRMALAEMAKIVGSNNLEVHTRATMKPDKEGEYFNLPKEHDLFYVLEKDEFLASAVVSPGSVEEVSAIVKLANQYLVPLWPCSMGCNLGKETLGWKCKANHGL